MIAIDASAFLAVYLGEPEQAEFRAILLEQDSVMSPVNHWEVLVRVHRDHGPTGVHRAEALFEKFGIEVVGLTSLDSRRAYEAFARFGKGSGGPLNLGDCFAYALAEREGDGLLFKGDDFPRTDVKSAI